MQTSAVSGSVLTFLEAPQAFSAGGSRAGLGLTFGYRYLYLDYSKRDAGAPTDFSYKGSQHGLLIGVLLKL